MNEHQRRKLRESAKTLTRLSGEEEGQEMADIGEIYKFRENFTDELALMQRRSDG